ANNRKPHEVRASSMAAQVTNFIASVRKTGKRSLETAVMKRQGVSIEMVGFMIVRVGDPLIWSKSRSGKSETCRASERRSRGNQRASNRYIKLQSAKPSAVIP